MFLSGGRWRAKALPFRGWGALVRCSRGRLVARGLLPAPPGSRVLATPLAASQFSAHAWVPRGGGALGWALPNPRRGVPGFYAGIAQLGASSTVVVGAWAAGRPTSRASFPGREGARWREAVGMGCHRNPALLSCSASGRAGTAPCPSPAAGLRLAPRDGAGVLGGAVGAPGPPRARGSWGGFWRCSV